MKQMASCAALLIALALLPGPAHAQEGRSLDLTIGTYGLSIGDAERVNGLRLNVRDRHLQRVNGINLTLWLPDDSLRGDANGLALGVPATGADDLNGIGLSVLGVQANGALRGLGVGGLGVGTGSDARGIVVAGLGAGAGGRLVGLGVGGLGVGAGGGARGILVGGLGVGTGGRFVGIGISGLGVGAGEGLDGLVAGGLGVGSGGAMRGAFVSGLGVGAGASLRGLAVAGVGVGAGENVTGIMLAGVGAGAGEQVTGLAVSGGALGSGGRLRGVMLAGAGMGAPTIQGVAAGTVVGAKHASGAMVAPAYFRIVDGGRFTGGTVSAFNHIQGTQRGLSIGIYNYARHLNGVQFGLVNYAANNAWPFRLLPVLNASF